jgi:hypothetical protein
VFGEVASVLLCALVAWVLVVQQVRDDTDWWL